MCIRDSARINKAKNGYQFFFTVEIYPEDAKKFKEVTARCPVDPSGEHLDPNYCMLRLYIDGENISNLTIAADLRGKQVEMAQIQGFEKTKEDAKKEMRRLQAILSTGALPTKLNIVAINEISPKLGKNFLRKALSAGIVALIGVAIIVYMRYRNPAIVLPVLIASASEVIIILGVANVISWTIDLSALAGLITAVGTSVDSQIIITDEMLRGEYRRTKVYGWKAKLKRAFFIIFAAASTTISAMLPLSFVGLGAVKGFAVTTILGVLASVLISRPAFIKIMEQILRR